MSLAKRYAARRELQDAAASVRRAIKQAQWSDVDRETVDRMAALCVELKTLAESIDLEPKRNPEPKPGVERPAPNPTKPYTRRGG